MIPLWVIYLAAALFANLHAYRQQHIIQPLVKILQRRMPTISDTEREAIQAGNVWWEKELFCGSPSWKKLLSMPRPALSDEEQHFLDNQVETLCGMLNDWEIMQQHDLPAQVWSYLKKEGFFGMAIPKEYGGRGFSALAHSTVIVKIATRSISAAVNTMVPNSLGPAELLLHYGTAEQKNYYLPRLAKGEEMPCFALTAPEAGSDAGAIPDTGIICRGMYEGKEVIGMRLTWDKRYITLAPIATLLGLAFRLYDPEHLLGQKEDLGITLCLLPTAHPGVEIGTRHLPLHLAFLNGPTRGKDVFVPLDWIIGGPAMAGQGWHMLMECLSIGRSISLPALSTACGNVAYRFTGAYARIRKQFNLPIAYFEGVEESLGNIAGKMYLMEACRRMTAGAVDQKIKPSIPSAIAKYHMTEMSRQIVESAMDVHGGHMIQVGPRNFLATAHMSMPISITVEGANILTRNLIIFGQGAIRCHPYLLEEVELLSAPLTADANNKLDKLLLTHVSYSLSNLARSFWYGITGGWGMLAVPHEFAAYYRQLTRMSTALSLLADVSLMLLGGNLKRKERISARLGDILSQLYLASTILKYYHDQGEGDDKDYVRWGIQYCLYKIQVACDELLDNFPIRWLGKILHWVIFPYGRAYHKPNDKLYRKIVKTMLAPSSLRERLTRYCYVGKNEDELTSLLEVGLTQVADIDPLWKKLQAAIRHGVVPRYGHLDERLQAAIHADILSEREAQSVADFEKLRKEIIKVNEFSFNLDKVVA
ncbi:MAG: acyl-CoA dehydrogenase [Gammaproteobacteria bacterium RIFCSPHIGHO2_12_FULL_41_20]|nr:MAG: acyl-CoA dehydrogenase [Gammaproteobacteria bacterium RIFCSPHIGHO2_12_FULL_41_20]